MNCCVLPRGIDADCGFTAIETRDGAKPVPLRGAVCGLLLALSLTRSLPVLAPIAFAVNTTVTVQVAFAARMLGLMGQFDVDTKSAKVLTMPVIVSPTV